MQYATNDVNPDTVSGLFSEPREPPLDKRLELTTFISTMFEAGDLVEIRAIESWRERGKQRSRVVERLWLEAAKVPLAWTRLSELNASGANIYFGVNPRTTRSGTKDSVQIVRSVWMDFDGVTFEEAKASWHQHLPGEPSIIIMSGRGIHAYCVLQSPFVIGSYAHRRHFEKMLRAIYGAVGCDAVQDVCRVLRLPGFWNVKSLRNGVPPMPCELIACDPRRTYPFSAFSSWWKRAEKEAAAKPDTAGWELAALEYLHNPNTEELLLELDRGVRDRSRRDYAIILGLLRLGLNPDDIWPLVKSKSKFRARGKEYFDVTIQNAVRELDRFVARLPTLAVVVGGAVGRASGNLEIHNCSFSEKRSAYPGYILT